ncbi:hypothetical protein [Zunongwangia pacifica]|uniref:Uncharacterized protein n=1 Tax=Zunongwangia pacifica TaxID=2911062 RepID=A0A9X1ZTV1_9FLAO|nr:hypothetical protein [Zunongwangia pacifica]MCL6220917.1 hypothetical protein [Zunongwangia pacifica]
MNSIKKTLLIAFLIIPGILLSQCPTGDIYLQSNNDVEEFIRDYSDCEVIEGNIIIAHETTDISGLDFINIFCLETKSPFSYFLSSILSN